MEKGHRVREIRAGTGGGSNRNTNKKINIKKVYFSAEVRRTERRRI